VSGRLKSIIKHRILRVRGRVGGPILTIYALCDRFLHNELPFGGRSDCTRVEISSGVNPLIAINSLMRQRVNLTALVIC